MKRNIYFLTLLICSHNIAAQIKKPNIFSLNGIISSDYNGYIYLSYNNVKDSCLVINNKFQFKGQLKSEAVANFTTNKPTSMIKDFYLENKNINIDISISAKTINSIDIDFVKINSISGTEISLIEKEYEDYKLEYQDDKDWEFKHYQKLEKLVIKYPRNKYIPDLLTMVSLDSLSNREKLQRLYKKLDLNYHSKSSLLTLKNNIFPIKALGLEKKCLILYLPMKTEKV